MDGLNQIDNTNSTTIHENTGFNKDLISRRSRQNFDSRLLVHIITVLLLVCCCCTCTESKVQETLDEKEYYSTTIVYKNEKSNISLKEIELLYNKSLASLYDESYVPVRRRRRKGRRQQQLRNDVYQYKDDGNNGNNETISSLKEISMTKRNIVKFEKQPVLRRFTDYQSVDTTKNSNNETPNTTYSRRFVSNNNDERLFLPRRNRYSLVAPSKVASTLLNFAKTYSNFITVSTAQKEYGLQAAYKRRFDCPYDKGITGCLNYLAIVYDKIVHPIGSDSYKSLPTILWSGELHGNERVGPTAVLEATRLLLLSAKCESFIDQQSSQSISCRASLKSKYGISDENRMWLARLVTTRRIIVVPTANAVGYYRNVRFENGIDMNRDFPYDLSNPKSCMQTIGARTLNELHRSYIIQLALTYHGGTECIAYEWGATSWVGSFSPDDIGQNRISASLRQYAGKFGMTAYYPIGPSNDLLYDIRGGMEDWAYAGSWDPERVIQCNPTTWGGYSLNKTKYGSADLRIFNLLVETSYAKRPLPSLLGTYENVLRPASNGNGHVPRNIRVSLGTAELVEPYVSIQSINSIIRVRDLIPLQPRSGQSCRTNVNNIVTMSISSSTVVSVKWIVGGGLVVDKTQLWHAKWDNVPNANCLNQPLANITKSMKAGTMVTSRFGVGRYTVTENATMFEGTFNITKSGYTINDEILILISATVDQKWKDGVENMNPNIPPQSHIANVRTNTSWYYKNSNNFIVQGRTKWFSIPLTIKFSK